MTTDQPNFSEVVESAYSLPLEQRLELKSLLEKNIEEARREEIAENALLARKELSEGKLKFSADIEQLKKML